MLSSQFTYLNSRLSSFTFLMVIYNPVCGDEGITHNILNLYISGTRNDVITAIGKGRKLPLPEEDELSTLPGYCVRVHATGKIEVKKQKIVDE